MRALSVIAALFVAGCSAHPPVSQTCPPPVAVPAGAPHKPTAAQVGALEVRVETAREAERARGDACAAALAAIQKR